MRPCLDSESRHLPAFGSPPAGSNAGAREQTPNGAGSRQTPVPEAKEGWHSPLVFLPDSSVLRDSKIQGPCWLQQVYLLCSQIPPHFQQLFFKPLDARNFSVRLAQFLRPAADAR